MAGVSGLTISNLDKCRTSQAQPSKEIKSLLYSSIGKNPCSSAQGRAQHMWLSAKHSTTCGCQYGTGSMGSAGKKNDEKAEDCKHACTSTIMYTTSTRRFVVPSLQLGQGKAGVKLHACKQPLLSLRNARALPLPSFLQTCLTSLPWHLQTQRKAPFRAKPSPCKTLYIPRPHFLPTRPRSETVFEATWPKAGMCDDRNLRAHTILQKENLQGCQTMV
eukprot:1160112-Pelagomonas_calceolata.AAC.6